MTKVEKEEVVYTLFKKNFHLLNPKNIENKKFKFEELEKVPNNTILKCIVDFKEDNVEVTTTYTNTEPVEHQEIISLRLLHEIENDSINYKLKEDKKLLCFEDKMIVTTLEKQNNFLFCVSKDKNQDQFLEACDFESNKKWKIKLPDSDEIRQSTMNEHLYAHRNSDDKIYLFKIDKKTDYLYCTGYSKDFFHTHSIYLNKNVFFFNDLNDCYIWNLDINGFQKLTRENSTKKVSRNEEFIRMCCVIGENLFIQTAHKTYRYSLNNEDEGLCIFDAKKTKWLMY